MEGKLDGSRAHCQGKQKMRGLLQATLQRRGRQHTRAFEDTGFSGITWGDLLVGCNFSHGDMQPPATSTLQSLGESVAQTSWSEVSPSPKQMGGSAPQEGQCGKEA